MKKATCDFNDGHKCDKNADTLGVNDKNEIVAYVCEPHSDELAGDADMNDVTWFKLCSHSSKTSEEEKNLHILLRNWLAWFDLNNPSDSGMADESREILKRLRAFFPKPKHFLDCETSEEDAKLGDSLASVIGDTFIERNHDAPTRQWRDIAKALRVNGFKIIAR